MAQIEELLVTTDTAWPQQGEWTYEDYLNLPEDGRRYEIIEEVLYVTNAPDIDHQFAVLEIASQLKSFARENRLGYVLAAPFEVHLAQRTRPVQPDVLFIKAENWPASGAKFFAGVPDVVVEVLSRSTLRTDRQIKFTAYEQAGVPEYWIVDPKSRSVEVYTLSGQEYALLGQFVGEELVQSNVLPRLQLVTHSLFMPGS